ncbi:ascBF operon repressor [Klebsiella pneumoniae]|nr:ascBF operon repressor [Klebsiella pneumoniae]
MRLAHRDIAFITGSLDSPTGVERLAGYKDALAGHGIALNEALIAEGRWTPETGGGGGGEPASARGYLQRAGGEQ